MNKMRLVDGTEYTLLNSISEIKNTLTVTVVTDDFASLRQDITEENLLEVSIYVNDLLNGFYEGYTQISPYNVDGDNITFTLTKKDMIQIRLTNAEKTIEALQDMFVMML